MGQEDSGRCIIGIFSPSGASPITGSTTLVGKKTPNIQNVSLPVAGTEYSFTIPAGSVYCEFISQECGKLQFAFTATESSTKYRTVWPGNEYIINNLDSSNGAITVYVQSTKTNDVLEIVSWT